MNPEIKAKWLEALRSGDYEQGTEFLLRHNKFCCLGVLCDLAVQAGIGRWTSPDTLGIQIFTTLGKSGIEAQVLPKSVRDWAGLSEISPRIKQDAQPFYIPGPTGSWQDASLVNFNDTGYDFLQIAYIIEAGF